MKDRVAVIIRRDDAILLIRRVKEGEEYYVIPGGGIEDGEPLEEAGRREILEELTLRVEVGPPLWREEDQGRTVTYFQAVSVSGEVRLGGPELHRQSATNQYHPEWVGLARLSEINLQPEPAKARIIDLWRRGRL